MTSKEIAEIEISGDIGPLIPQNGDAKYPMYSYSRPAYVFWNGFAKGLAKQGFSAEKIMEILQSRDVRHYLDAVDDQIEKLGEKLGKGMKYD